MDTPRTVIEINTSYPGTEVAADSAAALAAASIVFKGGVDSVYSSMLLKHSKSVCNMLQHAIEFLPIFFIFC